jgi:hypothetical protein
MLTSAAGAAAVLLSVAGLRHRRDAAAGDPVAARCRRRR